MSGLFTRCFIILFVGILMSDCANKQHEKMQIFQLAQVHNQAGKKDPTKPQATHYLAINYQPSDRGGISTSQKELIVNVIHHVGDVSDYRALISAAPIVSNKTLARNLRETQHLEKFMKTVKRFLHTYRMESSLFFNRKLPENQVSIEIRSKHKISSPLLNMQQLGVSQVDKLDEVKNKIRQAVF
jgi:hypothetical protein